PDARILFRGDSGVCRDWPMGWPDARNVQFMPGIARNRRLEEMLAPALDLARADPATRWSGNASSTGAPTRPEFTHEDSWSRSRRVIGRAEHTGRGANPR
ncbi:MAG: transposase, partial [Planctomycetota bacterium]